MGAGELKYPAPADEGEMSAVGSWGEGEAGFGGVDMGAFPAETATAAEVQCIGKGKGQGLRGYFPVKCGSVRYVRQPRSRVFCLARPLLWAASGMTLADQTLRVWQPTRACFTGEELWIGAEMSVGSAMDHTQNSCASGGGGVDPLC